MIGLWIKDHRKAIMGAITTGVATLSTAWADGGVTGPEWLAVVLAAAAGGGLVFSVRNGDAPAASGFSPERET